MGTDNLVIVCLESEHGISTRAIFRDVTVWQDATFASKNELALYIARKFARRFPLKFVWQRAARVAD